KTIGDKATGAITVYNWSDVQVTFDVGQTFTVNQNQEGAGFVYIATEQVSVGARTDESSGPGQSTRTAGTATVSVQAEDVGAIYNLPAELYFTVSGYSFGDDDGQMQGYNTQLFTGGNTEEVTIVAEGDILDAFETLKADLEPRAREELESKQNGRRLISEYLPINVANNVSDKEAGDEADVFNVTTALGATGYFYSQDDVQTLFESLFMDDIPEGFTLSDENVSVSVSYVGLTEEGFVQVSVSGEVLLVPELDRDALKAELSGDRLEEAQNYISSIEHVSEGSIEIWPRLPGSLQRLPYRPERISITIQEE
ncbi:hypothetical protein KC573_00230, partial [candidate division WWE3 bacterium]|nr:hypothetical protein [candidate division WWE3 bacterium]